MFLILFHLPYGFPSSPFNAFSLWFGLKSAPALNCSSKLPNPSFFSDLDAFGTIKNGNVF